MAKVQIESAELSDETRSFKRVYLFPVLVGITIAVTIWLCSTTLVNNVDIAVMKSEIKSWKDSLCEIKQTVKEIRQDQIDRKIAGAPEYDGARK